MTIFKRKPKGKFIYTYTVSGKPKVIQADSMQDMMDKIIPKHMSSYASGKIDFISSNDPDAPKEECIIRSRGGFFNNMAEVTPVSSLPKNA